MLHEQAIHIGLFNKVDIRVTLFDWYFIFNRKVKNLGDRDNHTWVFLCFEIFFITLSKQGKEGRAYRKKLRESGEWTLKES